MSRSIVIVHEQESVVTSLAMAFARAGYQPRGAYTFRDAVALMDLVDPAAVVVSLELGPFNGLHLLLRSAVEHPSAKVIVLGPANNAIEDEARALGASAYVPRPVDVEALVDAVNALFVETLQAEPVNLLHVRHA